MADESKADAEGNALALKWSFGFNSQIVGGVHSLSDDSRDAIFYVAAHTGVIYDYRHRRQTLLQGHCNPITCCSVSDDKRWIATADAGPDSMIVIWDSTTGTPIKTIFNPHPNGVCAMDMSPDAMFIVTLSHVDDEDGEQAISLWEWTVDRDGPLYTSPVEVGNVQTCIKFNHDDIREVVTNGTQRVVFWSWHAKKFKFYSPPISQRDFRQTIGDFTMSVFLHGTTQAVSATVDGDVLLWDQDSTSESKAATDRNAVKVVRISHKGAISFLGVTGNLLYTGTEEGCVRFFDFGFRLVAWFEDMDAGPIRSVSFAQDTSLPMEDAETFSVPDFLCGTGHGLVVGMQASMFEELSADQRRGTLLVQGMDDEIHGLATHPFLPQMVLVAYSGAVQVWDYNERVLLTVRRFDASKLRPHTVTYDPLGRFIAIGFTNGAVKVLDAERLQDTQTPIKNSLGCVTDIRFSNDGSYMATADADRCVALYRYMRAPLRRAGFDASATEDDDDALREVEQWVYLGKNRAHSRPITGMEFGMDAAGRPLLVSCGEDRRLVEYDVTGSSIAKGIVVKGKRVKAEQTAVPTACMWHPPQTHSREDLLITASDEYKLKLWNATNKSCRRTLLGPTYGGPINRMVRLPRPHEAPAVGEGDASSASEVIVYATAEKVVGLLLLPLDGNPDTSMGLIAHPREVSAVAPSFDGKHVLTAGGADGVVNLWSVDTSGLEKIAAEGRSGDGMDPFLKLLDGGRGGAFYEEIADYFYYAQLRSQGEDTTSPRRATGRVPLAELPNLMRALGYYPTEQEIENMCSEIKYSTFTETGTTTDDLDINDLIKLYLNHRPVLGIGKAQIADALRLIGDATGGGDGESGVDWSVLSRLLKSKSEALSHQELLTCVHALIGDEEVTGSMTAHRMAHDMLGFEDYDAAAVPEAEVIG